MSEPKERSGSSLDGILPEIIVKGGTTSSRYDNERAKAAHAAELGRAHQDKQMQAAQIGDAFTDQGFVHSRLHSLRLMDSGSPQIVLYYLNKDKTVRQSCVGEVVVTPDGDEVFTMVCPRCLERGEPHGSSQMMIKKSHRKWELDTRKQGTVVLLEDPWGKPFQVKICGTIWCEETLRCSNFNCAYAVRVEDSKVEEV
jgi:hypothetical protein